MIFPWMGEGGWFQDGSSALHLLCTSFLLYYISSTSDHQALDPEVGEPFCRQLGFSREPQEIGRVLSLHIPHYRHCWRHAVEVLKSQPCYIQIITPVSRKGHRGSEKLCLGWGSTGSERTGYGLSPDPSNFTIRALSSLCSPLTHLYQLQILNPQQRQENFLSYYI